MNCNLNFARGTKQVFNNAQLKFTAYCKWLLLRLCFKIIYRMETLHLLAM